MNKSTKGFLKGMIGVFAAAGFFGLYQQAKEDVSYSPSRELPVESRQMLLDKNAFERTPIIFQGEKAIFLEPVRYTGTCYLSINIGGRQALSAVECVHFTPLTKY